MLNQEMLLELTESYLKALVAETTISSGTDFDSSAPFGELGIDSFRVLKIVKALEADFGTLPKTLLFENFNVEALARYFVEKHSQALAVRFSMDQQSTQSSRLAQPEKSAKSASKMASGAPIQTATVPSLRPALAESLPVAAADAAWKTSIRLLEKDLPKYQELEALVKDLFERYKNEGCVSRGTRNIAPNLFIGSARKGYFNYSRSNDVILVYAYTGAKDYFPEIAKEMYRYCVEKYFQLNIFVDEVIDAIDGIPFSATPFGALQRVLNIQNFTLEGSAMRRLRYQVSKFEKAGACRTQEYKCGTDKDVDSDIADVIDRWCATKTMVNPLIHIVRDEVLAGTLHPQHRIFLTHLDGKLQNVILISAMCSALNGYLMDLEFYGQDMPLGGLEYAIVKIINTLAAEGCSMFSLGGTYGCRLNASPHADLEVERILDDLHKQNIFNDEGNLQFKNKFRPENRSIYLCRPIGSGKADNVIDLIMMIADPAKAQTSDHENHNIGRELMVVDERPVENNYPDTNTQILEGEARLPALVEFGFNPLNIPSDRIDYELKTDSWAQLGTAPFVERQMEHLRAQLQQPVNVNESLSSLFPFKYFVLTDGGRSADHLFCKAWPKKGVVLQNLLFPTCIYHQIDKGFTPYELPHPEVFRGDSEEVYKSNLDWDALQDYVARHSSEIAYVCIEVSDNAAGGHPVSMQHLKQVKDLLSAHSISLVIDGTRILENAQYLVEHEKQYAGRALWDVAREILSYADVVIGSLAKDFCVNKGGVIATNDENLLRTVQGLVRQEGGGLNVIEKKLIALALQNRKQIEAWVVRRMRAVESIWQALKDEQVPVVRPAGGHCVIIDVMRLPQFRDFENPVASFLAWLYLNTGIRAGAHSVGMQKNSPINNQVRLAIPVGLKNEQIDDIVCRLVRLFRENRNIPELKPSGTASETFGAVHANYELIRYHGASQNGVVATDSPFRGAATLAAVPEKKLSKPQGSMPLPTFTAPLKSVVPNVSRSDIAIVGMSGRYPKAKNILEFWENLKEGRDCVGDIPQARIAQRIQNEYTQPYRGGFLDDVDKFDSLFFNISPREAEFLDPQERLFLEVAWEALEDAGYYPEILAREDGTRNVGVFVGAVWAMYQIVGVEEKLLGNNVNPNSFLWSIANRVSYWMNLTGPSLTVDTACSSSLTALYLACEAVHNGDCSSAIVGGVNLDLHQHKFDINFAGGALSSDGVCRSFGAGANGYVAGEGVGAVFIKPLDKAIEDHDNIYGVIKSALVNHGGRTSGYTVPNPKAQGDLIAAALEKAKVDARTIGYIEAHGTGTELGDPVEISGLTKAFESYKVGSQVCPIGSVKTNIGHLEAAAGVVGVCKVLLQMKYKQLVPSLHSAQLNEYIDFKNSPFYVQQRLEAWNEKVIDGVRFPLRAGLSSFGAGGANAHIVFENYELPVVVPASQSGDYIFPLSAKNDEQLREMAIRLRKHLELDFPQQQLNDIAFTLQNGRKSFEHRLAVVAKTKKELVEKLDLFLNGKKDADVISGHAKNSEGITKLLSRKEKEQFVGLLSESRAPHKLAQLWIDGLLSDCRGFPQEGGRRTSLPTYPFADKRHWIGAGKAAIKTTSLQVHRGVHPLIDSNESTFQRQLFRKTFHGQEFILRDHVVADIPTLPGTAYLDLARKAGEIAAGIKVQKIRNITWVSPFSVEGSTPTDMLIELKPGSDSAVFEVFSEGVDGKRKLHSQGKLVYANELAVAPVPEFVDIAAIRARCSKTIAGKEAYPLFKSVGLNYGSSFQVLQEVYKNEDEVLGLLKLPEVRNADFDQFILHPCILDASMQAGVVAQLGEASGEMKIPYSIGEVEIIHPLTRICYSYVTKMNKDKNMDSGVSRENVTIVDEAGKILARISDSVGVPLVSVHEKLAPVQAEEEFVELYYSHIWRKLTLPDAQSDVRSLLLFDTDDRMRNACVKRNIKTVLVLPGDKFLDLGNDTYEINPQDRQDYTRLFEALSLRNLTAEKICYAWADSSSPRDENALRKALASGVYSFLFCCQALIEQKQRGKVQILYLYFGKQNTSQAHNEAINGFARSVHLENPKIDCKVLEIRQDKIDPNDVLSSILDELHSGNQSEMTVRYENRVRYARTLKKLDSAELEGSGSHGIVLKQNGVYLITGGAGGLGLIFGEFLARQCQVRLVLTGRSELTAECEAQLEDLRRMGAEVLYISTDVSKSEDVRGMLDRVKSRFGRINGIVHSAGVLRDSFLRKKTPEEMEAVFAPKIFGTFYLDEQTRDEDLDFFVTFSSLAAVGGNAGQCDYAFANHYMDSFAAERELLRASGRRKGKTLSINWSLWADGGMKLDEQTEIFFRKNLGIKPLNKETGLQSFVKGLLLNRPHIAVLEGIQTKIEHAWGLAKREVVHIPADDREKLAAVDGEDIPRLVTRELSNKVSELLKLSAEDFSPDSILTDLGFDSIGLATFANAINDKYQLDINPVLFFEYPSVRAIARALVTEHEAAVRNVHGGGAFASAAQPRFAPSVAVSERTTLNSEPNFTINKNWEPSASRDRRGDFSRKHRFTDMPIAIVGIAGVMPQSANLEEFWDNLKNARNLVTEIPRDRWIWEEYDGNPVKEVNKSNSRWGGFMTEVDKFDPLFFGITPREAEMMDPQQRIFIETVWSAIEDSGHKVSDLSGTKTGVFVGVSAKDYIDVLAAHKLTLDGFSASGNSHSILANRVSFLLNLRGPSAPLDTACSSSVIALHRAIESIHTGSSDMAIVGGVQVMLTPVGHISLSSAGMLSVDGKCKTFDKDANGYVRGEGSGAIFIKPLAKAEEEGDPIYAVIKATAENHGGRVTMLTAPNPKAQAELLFEAYEKAQIDPTTVGYIECHGTGTSLGDPIEIQALKNTFSDLYKKYNKAPSKSPHCGLTSVKTNIGHLEPAAGIASLLKVLLSIKHKQIPALIHFEELNPYIDLNGSPFYIVDKTIPWDAPIGQDGAPLPRRAGVSSFGWGGANAHAVLEEYMPQSRQLSQEKSPQPIMLSARNEDRLKAYARSLLAHIRKRDVEFVDLAYTLQIGRDPMEERLAMIVESTDELANKLEAFVAGERNIDYVYRGRSSRHKRDDYGLSAINPDSATRGKDISEWIACRNYSRLLEAWVNGADIDWTILHASAQDRSKPRRVSLPSYPFTRDKIWIDTGASKNVAKSGIEAAVLHPLLHSNISVLGQQRYSSMFSGKELLLIDHQKTLPAFAYLEMARAAVALAISAQDGSAVELLGAEWPAAVMIAEKHPITVSVYEGRNNQVDYEIHSADHDVEGRARKLIHCRGAARFDRVPAPARLDIEQLKSLMRYGKLDRSCIDAALKNIRPSRGASLQGIKAIYQGYQQQLVQLDLPTSMENTLQEYVLHPTIMDSVLQSAIALATDMNPFPGQFSLPSTLGSLLVLAPCTREMYAWVRYSRGYKAGGKTIKLDVDVTDSHGAICVRMKSLTLDSQEADFAGEAQNEDFAGLLESVYQLNVDASENTEVGTAKDEFEKILEEIL